MMKSVDVLIAFEGIISETFFYHNNFGMKNWYIFLIFCHKSLLIPKVLIYSGMEFCSKKLSVYLK